MTKSGPGQPVKLLLHFALSINATNAYLAFQVPHFDLPIGTASGKKLGTFAETDCVDYWQRTIMLRWQYSHHSPSDIVQGQLATDTSSHNYTIVLVPARGMHQAIMLECGNMRCL